MKKVFLLVSLIALSAASLCAQNLSNFNRWQRSYIPDDPSDSLVHKIVVSGTGTAGTIQSADMIHSVCVNMEHSYQADITIRVECPNGRSTYLKKPEDSYRSGASLGYPYGGSHHHEFDGENYADSLENPFGIGLDYCFSRNAHCTLVTGDPADAAFANNAPCLGIAGYIDTFTVTFNAIPAYFHQGGQCADTQQIVTSRPSNVASSSDYYTPYGDFADLEGCPVNGEWKIVVKDSWGVDNGWLFGATIVFAGLGNEDITTVVSQPNPIVSVAGRTIMVRNLQSSVLRVFDMMGRMVYQANNPAASCTIPVSAAGIYLVQTDNRSFQRVAVM